MCIRDRAQTNMQALCDFEAQNGAALKELVEKHHVEVRKLSPETLADLRVLAREVVAEEAAKSPMATKVAKGFNEFQKQWGSWADVSSRTYFDTMAIGV